MHKLKIEWTRKRLDFTFEARTSRGSMFHKDTYFVKICNSEQPEVYGLGECPLFAGLSREDTPEYEKLLSAACAKVEQTGALPADAPSSVRMGLETAMKDLENRGRGIVFPRSRWIQGNHIEINGLVWMGDKKLMKDRISQKLADGFKCVKLKIGGIDFEDELALLSMIRKVYGSEYLELRVDANGAFTPDNAMTKLEALAQYDIHSIEQPIAAGQYDAMERLCRKSPVPIALDEELIGDTTSSFKDQLLAFIRPAYIILKPALCGGFAGADSWIRAAEKNNVGWWATSALESAIGLNAIAQWAGTYPLVLPQGLGTGALYSNNVPAQYKLIGSNLCFEQSRRRATAQECGF